MHSSRTPAWVGLLIIAGVAMAAGANDPAAEAVLKKNSLRRSGATYILPGEAELAKKLKAARELSQQLGYALMQQRGLEYMGEASQATIEQLVERRMQLNQQLRVAPSTVEHNTIVTMLNEVNDQIYLLQNRSKVLDPQAKKRIASVASEKREAYMQAILNLRALVDETQRTYVSLAGSDEVKNALAALNQGTKVKLTLGPSRSFLSNVKLLEKVEASVVTEDVPIRDRGGVFEVDVVFNGKILKPMILDTGASFVSLSASVAGQIGLKPTDSDPTVMTQIADGSKVPAKLMKIKSVRVGKFTVNDVPCIVSIAEQGDVPLLLGGSFLKNFTYRVNPEGGKLILTKVDSEESASAARTKTTGKKSTRTVKGKKAPQVVAEEPAEAAPDETPKRAEPAAVKKAESTGPERKPAAQPDPTPKPGHEFDEPSPK